MVQASRPIPVLALLAWSQTGPTTERAWLNQQTLRLHYQQSDSVVSAVAPPEGGRIELPGFATVIFPAGAFDSPREVTVEATVLPTWRRIIDVSMVLTRSAPALAHEIRVTTGASPPATEIEVLVNVPDAYVSGLPSDHTVALYALEVTGGAEERIERFSRFASEFDSETGVARAQLPARVFDDLQRVAGVFEAIITVGSRVVTGGTAGQQSSTTTTSPQVLDSVVSMRIPATGGIAELPGFATVTFPAGAFDSTREVTVEATSEPGERGIFRMGYRAPPAAHEIRVTTGETPPATAIEVALNVPAEFLNTLPPDRTVDLYVRGAEGGAGERHRKYFRLPSEFDAAANVVRAEVPNRFFGRFRGPGGSDPGRSRRNEVVIMIGSVPKR